MTEATAAPPAHRRPAWAPLTLAAWVGLVVCSNIANGAWGELVESNPELLLALSSRIRYLVFALGGNVDLVAYWGIGFARIAVAFIICHLIGRAYSQEALGWFVKYLGFTPETIDQFDRSFAKTERWLIPVFAGSNLVAAISGVHRTPWRRLIGLLSVGIVVRLALLWWLTTLIQDELEAVVGWVARYSWWVVGVSVVLVVYINMRNFRRGGAA